MSDNAGAEKEKHMKQLKRKMECWREVVLPLNSILLWEQPWYPGLIIGFTSSIFFAIWMMEPALLTMISLFLLALALADYFVPLVTSIFCPADNWSGPKEKKLNEICQNASATILQIQNWWKSMQETRNNRPTLYYGGISVLLIICAWVGNIINNLLLFYLAVNAVLLTPGLRYKGRAREAIKYIYNHITHRHLA